MNYVDQNTVYKKSERDMGSKADYNSLSDIELVSQLKAGNPMAFTAIVERHYNLLFSFAYRRLEDKEQAKDTIYDAFADLWEKHDRIGEVPNLEAFLITVVKNRILNHYRRQKISRRYIDHFQQYLNTHQNDSDHLVRHNDLKTLIEKEIAALPEKMRVVFELSRKNGMNRSEIAEHLDIPENTVKTNLQRALRILRGKLPPNGFSSLFTFL